MIDVACMRAKRWIDRRAAGLSSADALRLEDHLAGCGQCTHDAELLDGLRRIATQRDVTLSNEVRQRVMLGALREAAVARPQPRELGLWRVSGALALCAAVALGFLLRGSLVEQPPAKDVVADGTTFAPEVDTTVALAHAQVLLRAHSVARWNARAHDLSLTQGSVFVEVDPKPKAPFSVTTPRFAVHVLGTRFSVTMAAVRVERGRVRVLAPDAQELAVLGAGERFAIDDAQAQAAVEPEPVAAPLAVPAEPAAAARATRETSRSARLMREAPPRVREDAAQLLDRARTELAARRVPLARAALEAALAQKLAPASRAEALTLRAECARLEGDQASAVEAYLRVARSFESLAAGENALFSAARLEMERGHSAASAQLFTRYLERYPSGRFVREARTRLHNLNAVLDHGP